MPQQEKKQVAILEDHALTRFGIVATINAHPHYQVVHWSDSAEAFLSYMYAHYKEIDLCVLDIFLPGATNGLAVLKKIKTIDPDMQALMLTCSNSKLHRRSSLRNGACGYVLKNEPLDIVHEALSNILLYNFAVNPIAVKPPTIEGFSQDEVLPNLEFSAEEMELIKLFCTSLTYPAIADKLKTTAKVIDHRRERLFKKCQVTTRTSLIYFAFQVGLLHVEDSTTLFDE